MTTPAPVQTTASGRSPVERYAGLSGARSSLKTDPHSILALVISSPGGGKSRFFQDCPDGYYMNVERVSTSHPDPRSPMWPPLNSDGSLKVVDYSDWAREIQALLKLAAQGAARPRTIFIDSLPALENLLFRWIPPHAPEFGLAKEPKKTWDDFGDPRSAYRVLYDTLVNQFVSLRDAGYGVYCCCHVTEKVIPMGDDKNTITPELTMGNGLWMRMKWRFEMVASILKSVSLKREVVERANTAGVSRPTTEFVKTLSHTLTVSPTSDPLCEKILKCKHPLPDVVLPEVGSWEAFITAYTQAAQTESPS